MSSLDRNGDMDIDYDIRSGSHMTHSAHSTTTDEYADPGSESQSEEEEDIDAYFNLSQEEFQFVSSARDSIKTSRSRNSDLYNAASASRTSELYTAPSASRTSDLYTSVNSSNTATKLEKQSSSQNNKDHYDRRKASGSDSVISASNLTVTESYNSNFEFMSTCSSPRSNANKDYSDYPRENSLDYPRENSLDYTRGNSLDYPRGNSLDYARGNSLDYPCQNSLDYPRDYPDYTRTSSLETYYSDLFKDNLSCHESISVIALRLEEIEKQEKLKHDQEKLGKEHVGQEKLEQDKPKEQPQHGATENNEQVVSPTTSTIDKVGPPSTSPPTNTEPKDTPSEPPKDEPISGVKPGRRFFTTVNRVAKLRKEMSQQSQDGESGENMVSIVLFYVILGG